MARRNARGQHALATRFLESHPSEAAAILEDAQLGELVTLLAGEPAARATEIVRHLSPDRADEALSSMDAARAARILEALEPQRAAALISRLPEDVRSERLARLAPRLAEELRELSSYPLDTAGGMMDPRVTAFSPETRVGDVVRRLRTLRRRRVEDVFVVDADGHLRGRLSLQEVVLADPSADLRSLAGPSPHVQATSPREEVLQELERHRGGSIAVVDFEGHLLGVLRQRELLAATQQQATAELVTMVGASADERALSPPSFAVRKRLPWLQINLATAFLAASVVGIFEETIARNTALAVLLPVVAGQSGNTGAQALAVTMRGLALREVRLRQWLRVTVKEALVGATNGLAVALTTAAAVYFWSQSAGLALVIGLSMVLSMSAAGISGAAIPMLLTAWRQDPAQSSSIILTTVTDVVGFFSFLGIATLLSRLL